MAWPDPPSGLTADEVEAIRRDAREVAAAAPPPTPELIARLRPIFASTADEDAA